MTKELKVKLSEMTSDYLKMYNNGVVAQLPQEVQGLMYRMASAIQDAICADSRAKLKAHQTRIDNEYWRTR